MNKIKYNNVQSLYAVFEGFSIHVGTIHTQTHVGRSQSEYFNMTKYANTSMG